ncbi:MAG TPA: sigma-70 family RNA polymerase sigma factor [Candidatus Eisenbergiella merdipullorum]|uniref:Sigma-70 family RNA polymerase sigma factor n=1 Tax=Candidatus Eisenbergiella merdipullorum TaxID=2838553 RepID=A0A9D2I3Z6_9FIRM|nr:sigma-70 family RNA polymerase sigma factor [Candidatus Eisenbergiella merdipullorum]
MRGNKEFFEELYSSEYDNIKRYVRRMVTDTNGIEDIVQETFFEAYRKITYLRTHPNIPGWLRVTAKNKIMKWEEKQRKYSLDFDFVLKNTESVGKGRTMDDFKIVEAYSTVRNILSDEELEILRCYYEYGYTSQEMAKRLGITETCFKVRILRMKQKIKNSLQLPLFVCVGRLILEILRFLGE